MSAAPPISAVPLPPLRRDAAVMGLVGLAHCISHFSQLLLPPLFLWLKQDFNASYTELGVLLTIFFVVSCAVQALSGFVVDRFGPRPVLFAGIGLLALAAFGYAISTSYFMLAFFSVVAGIGNGVFHPVDYTLLNRKIHPKRLGHAFSVHGITGSLGWALAPAMMVSITLASSWRVALASAGALALVVMGVLWLNRAQLTIEMTSAAPSPRPDARAPAPRRQLRLPDDSRGLGLLRLLLPVRDRHQRHPGLRAGGGAPAACGAGGLGGDVPHLLHGRQRLRHGARRLSRHRSGALARRSSASASASPPCSR